MAVDTTDPPDYGNQTDAQFLLRRMMQVQAINQSNKDDTWATMTECVNALWYRQVIEDLFNIHQSLRGTHSTPLLQAIQAVAAQTTRWKPSDNGSQPLTLALLSDNSLESPTALWSLNGTRTDEVSGSAAFINQIPPAVSHGVYPLVSSSGSLQTDATQVYGLRCTGTRWHWADSALSALRSTEITASVTCVPQWPQANDGVVLLKVADYLSASETGAKRMGFEFGLGTGLVTGIDPLSTESDLCLYLRWYNSSDVEQKAIAVLAPDNDPVSITPGREYTLGFHRYDAGGGNWNVTFYINGAPVVGTSGLSIPSIAIDNDLRLHLGCTNQVPGVGINVKHLGGPAWNLYIKGMPTTTVGVNMDALHNGLYRIGAGYL